MYHSVYLMGKCSFCMQQQKPRRPIEKQKDAQGPGRLDVVFGIIVDTSVLCDRGCSCIVACTPRLTLLRCYAEWECEASLVSSTYSHSSRGPPRCMIAGMRALKRSQRVITARETIFTIGLPTHFLMSCYTQCDWSNVRHDVTWHHTSSDTRNARVNNLRNFSNEMGSLLYRGHL